MKVSSLLRTKRCILREHANVHAADISLASHFSSVMVPNNSHWCMISSTSFQEFRRNSSIASECLHNCTRLTMVWGLCMSTLFSRPLSIQLYESLFIFLFHPAISHGWHQSPQISLATSVPCKFLRHPLLFDS